MHIESFTLEGADCSLEIPRGGKVRMVEIIGTSITLSVECSKLSSSTSTRRFHVVINDSEFAGVGLEYVGCTIDHQTDTRYFVYEVIAW